MRIRVQGGAPLNGVYIPSGNPNAARATIAASMLTDQPVTLHRVPKNTSTLNTLAAAHSLGAQSEWTGEHSLRIVTPQVTSRTLGREIVGGATGALFFLAPLLARREHVRLEVDFPLSRIRTHLDAMRDLGLDVVVVQGAVEIRAADWAKADIVLDRPSVTATALGLMLAVSHGDNTTIRNAASEPHIADLAQLLGVMGSWVDGVGGNVLRVQGAPTLSGADVTISPDHIETASIAALVAVTGGRAQIVSYEDPHAEHETAMPDLRGIARVYARMGIGMDVDEAGVFITRHKRLSISNREEDVDSSIETAPWPGFPSDLVGVATVIATQAQGTSLIHETLFKDRLLFVDSLKDMGAQIILADPHRAIVVGPTPLRGAYIPTPDLRTGLGLLTAALVAEGESVIDNAEGFDYTFDGVLQKLRGLDAKITLEAP